MTENPDRDQPPSTRPPATVFEVLADPTTHQAIDGTGWVRESLDDEPLTEAGQIFRIAMYHDNHPDKHYEMANKVIVFEPDRASPGSRASGGRGRQSRVRRLDVALRPRRRSADDRTEVTLTYDWSSVPAELREHIRSRRSR